MERRRSLPRTSSNNSSPLSDHNSSPLRRSSISLSSPSPLHRPSNTTSTSSNTPSLIPRRALLQKQASSEDLQARLLWPSSKKPNPSSSSSSASTTYNGSTFSSRQRVSTDQDQKPGNRSLRHHLGKLKNKPGTPPSPSSSSSSVGRFSFTAAAPGGKRSDYGVDFPSAESDQGGVSPAKGKSGPGGIGSFISHGLNNLFRRKSFHASGGAEGSPKKPLAAGLIGSPGRERSGPMVLKGAGSPGRETMLTARAADGEVVQYKLRMLNNYLMQWRFVNAGVLVVDKIKCGNAERTLVNAWLGVSDLRTLVTKMRVQLEKDKFKFKLNTLVCYQTKALEKWGTMERQHLAALSSTKDSLQAAVCRLPITDRAKVDPHLLSISLRQATHIATAINGNIAKCHSRAQSTGPLVAELSQVVAREKLLLEECIELLGLVSTLQVHEESLRSNVIQLKAQHLTRCAAKGHGC